MLFIDDRGLEGGVVLFLEDLYGFLRVIEISRVLKKEGLRIKFMWYLVFGFYGNVWFFYKLE